jgi:pimeloyl-ACP methyl ester carboxylesterase
MSATTNERKTDMSELINTPTVVLVHGGFADASFWAPVIKELRADDVPILAPPNPLRGLARRSLSIRASRSARSSASAGSTQSSE